MSHKEGVMQKDFASHSLQPLCDDLELFKKMLRIRVIESELARVYNEKEMRCPVHFCIGQEAPAVGVVSALEKRDTILSPHRAHGHYLARGGNLNALVSELYGKANGCSSGKGGSMHLIDTSVNFLGSTSIVAGVISVGVGVGFAHKLKGSKAVSTVFFGDGATEEGLFYESINFAALHKLPVLFVCENNFYSVYSPLSVRQPPGRVITNVAESLGIATSRIIDGNDVRQVHDATVSALQQIRNGGGPFLIEAHTYRHIEHCGPNADDDLEYRPAAERTYWIENDPLKLMKTRLIERGDLAENEVDADIEAALVEIRSAITAAKAAPFPKKEEVFTDVYAPQSKPVNNPGSIKLGERSITYVQAVNEALRQAMERDDSVYVMGLGAPDPKGIFGSTLGLEKQFGSTRVFDAPISENALTGVAVGAAIRGMRPVLSHQRVDFIMMSMDQLVNNAAKWRYMFGGRQSVPLTIRAVIGRGWGQGPQHSQNLAAIFAHFPGLRVVAPTTPAEAKGTLLAAIESDDPVIVLEHRWLYNGVGVTPEEYYTGSLDKAVVMRRGKDFTIIATMDMVIESLRAAEVLARHGIDVEVINALSIKPLDHETFLTSIRQTGRLLIADSGWLAFGVSSEIAAVAAERCIDVLKSNIIRIGLPDAPSPSSPGLSEHFYPTAIQLCQSIGKTLGVTIDTAELDNDTEPRDIPDPYFSGPF